MATSKIQVDDDSSKPMVSYVLKQIKGHVYLYEISIGKDHRQIWKSHGNIKNLKPNDSRLKKAQSVYVGSKAKEIVEQYYAGKVDKDKTLSELKRLIDSV